MAARLLVFSGKLKGKALALPPEGKVILGRSQHAQVAIPDANLSRSHCAIVATARGYRIEDLQSTNGTQVNGKRIEQALLREGDRVVLGETEMEFRVKEGRDDIETKMDRVSVGQMKHKPPAVAAPAVDTIQSPKAPRRAPARQAAPPAAAKLSRVRFCDICDVTVAKPDIDSGSAREIGNRLLCTGCVGRLEGKNLDAAASIDRVLDELRTEVRRAAGG